MQRRTFLKVAVGAGSLAGLPVVAKASLEALSSLKYQTYRNEFRQMKMKILDGVIVAESETEDDLKLYRREFPRSDNDMFKYYTTIKTSLF